MDDGQAAIETLESLGLTEYEARCFVALTQLPHGTAKEIGQVADIPRSRVYETMERLQDMGLVELHEAEPREYQSVSIETAMDILRSEYETYFETLERSLTQLEPAYKKATQGVWALNSHEQVGGRIVDVLGEATDEVVFVLLDDDLLDDIADALGAAADRDVTVYVGAPAEVDTGGLADDAPEIELFATELIEWLGAMTGSPRIGRLVMVDRGPVLVSALHDEELPGVPNETAVWTDGIDHGFATFAERILTFELLATEGESPESLSSN